MSAHSPTTISTPVATPSEIERGMRTVARLVKLHGEEFLPFFAYLENELKIARERESLLDRLKAFE